MKKGEINKNVPENILSFNPSNLNTLSFNPLSLNINNI